MSAAASAPRILSLPLRAVDVGAIERELAQLWRDAEATPHPDDTGGGAAITRACMSNLIIFCAAYEQPNVIAEEVGGIVQHHPARVLLLIGGASDLASALEAYVAAQCHVAEGGRQVCSEYVTVSACGDALLRLPSVVRPLLVGDLPTALWWASGTPPPLGGSLFAELASMADQVIYDSFDWFDAVRGVLATADWAYTASRRGVADLAWRRLDPWRRLISQSLDPAIVPEALTSITQVRVEHGPHGLPQAWLLVGWLASALGWQLDTAAVAPGIEVTWNFRSARGPLRVAVRRCSEGAPDVRAVAITWAESSGPSTASFGVLGPGRLGVTMEAAPSLPRVLVVPLQSRAALLVQELPRLDRRTHFREVLAAARTMAQSLVH